MKISELTESNKNQALIDKVGSYLQKNISSAKEIAKEINQLHYEVVTPRQIENILARYYPDRTTKRIMSPTVSISDNEKQNIITTYTDRNTSIKQLAKKYNTTEQAITTILQNAIDPEEYEKIKKLFVASKGITSDQVQQMADMHRSGKGMIAIGKIFGVDAKAVRYHLQQLGPSIYNAIRNDYIANKQLHTEPKSSQTKIVRPGQPKL